RVNHYSGPKRPAVVCVNKEPVSVHANRRLTNTNFMMPECRNQVRGSSNNCGTIALQHRQTCRSGWKCQQVVTPAQVEVPAGCGTCHASRIEQTVAHATICSLRAS